MNCCAGRTETEKLISPTFIFLFLDVMILTSDLDVNAIFLEHNWLKAYYLEYIKYNFLFAVKFLHIKSSVKSKQVTKLVDLFGYPSKFTAVQLHRS